MLHVKLSAQTYTAAPHCGSHCHPAPRVFNTPCSAARALAVGDGVRRVMEAEVGPVLGVSVYDAAFPLAGEGDGGGAVALVTLRAAADAARLLGSKQLAVNSVTASSLSRELLVLRVRLLLSYQDYFMLY